MSIRKFIESSGRTAVRPYDIIMLIEIQSRSKLNAGSTWISPVLFFLRVSGTCFQTERTCTGDHDGNDQN